MPQTVCTSCGFLLRNIYGIILLIVTLRLTISILLCLQLLKINFNHIVMFFSGRGSTLATKTGQIHRVDWFYVDFRELLLGALSPGKLPFEAEAGAALLT